MEMNGDIVLPTTSTKFLAMKPRFTFKRTDQLEEHEKTQFLQLFSLVFSRSMTPSQFDRKYLRTTWGYSYHGLMLANNAVVGAYNTVPYSYYYFGKRVTFCLSVDTMVDQQYRRQHPLALLKMAKSVVDAMKQDGVCFAFGSPNDNAYSYTTKVLKWQKIGELDFYVLPRNLGAVIPKLRWLNFVSRACAGALVRLPLRKRRAKPTYHIEKKRDTLFAGHRYDSSYGFVELGCGSECTYKIYTEDLGVRALYLIDVHPLTPVTFDKAIERVYAECAHAVDIMLYVGKLPFVPTRMIKVPESRKPRRIQMCGKILDPHVMDERILQIENWNINISNLDVR
jgi:hypothetical protein